MLFTIFISFQSKRKSESTSSAPQKFYLKQATKKCSAFTTKRKKKRAAISLKWVVYVFKYYKNVLEKNHEIVAQSVNAKACKFSILIW